MLAVRSYYAVKPFLPKRVRYALHRASVSRRLARNSATWPIKETAARKPEGWLGWPEGKKFALVLTHDVESQTGLGRVRQLAELELQLGFRSSFNFVPEGDYVVPRELRDWLAAQGFETGVHDLRHDGKLFRSRESFREQAVRINRYLKEWNAVGFRAGFMFHNLNWQHDLQVRYDASTFDTDPFQPQCDDANTIFPFWVSDGNGGGYVELPYSLPQDSTLFLFFRHESIDIWVRKLAWVAQHGGMAMVITHPDYMNFDGPAGRASEYEFPVARYRELLQHVHNHYEGQFWHALPRDVAAHVQPGFVNHPEVSRAVVSGPGSSPRPVAPASATGGIGSSPVTAPEQRLRGRVLMLVENHFPQDTRVKNEAFLLQDNGYQVSVLCYRKASQPSFEVVNGVEVHRLPRFELFQKTPSGESSALARLFLRLKSFIGYLFEYAYFTSLCFFGSVRVFFKTGFDVMHVHNPPDTLFLVGLPFKLLGKKFVFDHHDLCPELYQSRYGAQRGFYTFLLALFEWCSLKLADVTIATNETYKEKQIERAGKRPERVFVVRNGPNQDRMQARTPAQRLRGLNKQILCYIGSLNPQDGLDYLLRALSHLRHDLQRDDFYCVIMGSGDSLEDLRSLARELKLDGSVELTGFISDQDLMENLAAADICVDPDPSSPLNDVSTWIKIMEYMACGKPIVSFDLKETRYSAQDAALFVPPNDELAFAKAIARLMDDPQLRQRMGSFGRQRVERELQWSVTGRNLLAAYATLIP